jgi:hypothetical protein
METLLNNQSMESMSQGPGMYRLTDAKLRNKISYPWAPNVQLQKMGGSVFEENFIDVESELNRLNKPLSNNPNLKYMPVEEEKEYSMINFKDGGPPPEEPTRLRNNAFELKGVGINRFDYLPFNPQKNSIEPFKRIGDNTVLFTLDKHSNECAYNFNKTGGNKPFNE